MEERNGTLVSTYFSIETVGFITWIVFLVLKLCNQNNPDFSWLTWFWVWFPLWIPVAVDLSLLCIAIVVFFIVEGLEIDR